MSRLEARRAELMNRVEGLQAQLAALVTEEEGLLRQQMEGEQLLVHFPKVCCLGGADHPMEVESVTFLPFKLLRLPKQQKLRH
jgi:hypothetical protein